MQDSENNGVSLRRRDLRFGFFVKYFAESLAQSCSILLKDVPIESQFS